jgi:hypothetical protein
MYSFFKMSILLLLMNIVLFSNSIYALTIFNYDYPFQGAYAATVLGTPIKFQAKLPKYDRIPFKEYSLDIPGRRNIPDVFWYHRKGLNYAITAQNKKAPLIFAIAGTGAGHHSAKMKLFQRAFYQAGFHVVTISSPTFTNFMVNASKTAVPGNLEEDSADLYNVMQLIMDKHQTLKVTDYNLIGYSLGASQAGFVALLDEREKTIGFNKVLMINPPLNLFHSVTLLDKMLTENIPGGLDNFNKFFNGFMANVTSYYQEHKKIALTGPDFFYNVYKNRKPSDSQLKTLIGVSFRMSSSDMMFVTDIMNNLGYLVPKNTKMTSTTSLTKYSKASRRLGFSDYVEEIYLPYFSNKTGISRDDLITQSSLLSIKEYLQSADNIGLMHNENDPILRKGEIDIIKSLFPDRAIIYPYGGHCGNMAYKDNVAHMVNFFLGNNFIGSHK